MHYGIDVGGTKTEFAIFDDAFARVDERRIDTITDDYGAFCAALVELVREADRVHGHLSSVGIGINNLSGD